MGSIPAIHKELGTDFDEKVLPSICNEVLKVRNESIIDSYTSEYVHLNLISLHA